jgi:hypothetical protein
MTSDLEPPPISSQKRASSDRRIAAEMPTSQDLREPANHRVSLANLSACHFRDQGVVLLFSSTERRKRTDAATL